MRREFDELSHAIAQTLRVLGGECSEALICICLKELLQAPIASVAPLVAARLREDRSFISRRMGEELHWSLEAQAVRPVIARLHA